MSKRFLQPIKVKVTKAVQNEKLHELVDIDRQIYDVEAEKSDTAKKYGSELKRLNKSKKALLDTIETGVAEVDVECEPRINDQRGEVEFVRVDTGEPIPEYTRALTAKERQLDIEEIVFELPKGAKPLPGEEGEECSDDDEEDDADPEDDEDEDEDE